MSSKADRTITEALGVPDSNNNTNIDFTAATASGLLTPGTYRFASDTDCYFKVADDNAAADDDDMLFFGGVPEVFSIRQNHSVVNVIRKDADGTLWITPLHTRGK